MSFVTSRRPPADAVGVSPDVSPPVGAVRWGALRRLEPVSRAFGFDRGRCIDRWYIERFLARHACDIRGKVLEVADGQYTEEFGGDQVVQSDVLHAVDGNPKATIVGDLTRPAGLPRGAFDCIILTQTLQHIYETRAAVSTLYGMLKPDGVVLATVPGISQISRYDMDRWGDYWRFTTLSARRMFEAVFDPDRVAVEAFGNILAATAFLHGLVAEELREHELNHRDPDYELLITIRARRSKGTGQ